MRKPETGMPGASGAAARTCSHLLITDSRDNVYPFEIKTRPTPYMPRPKRKTEATTLKMTPEVRQLWEKCAEREHRSLTNMFEVMVRDYAARQPDLAQPFPPASNNKT